MVALVGLADLSHGATISQPDSKRPDEIRFAGTIEGGEASVLEKFLAKLQAQKPVATGWLASIYFDSDGGDLGEALRVGTMLRKYKARSVVEGGKSCIDACAWAFLGGSAIDPRGETVSGRYLYPGAKLVFWGLTRDDETRFHGFVEMADVFAYADAMDVEFEWVMHIMNTEPSLSLPVQTVGQLLLLDIKLGAKPPITLPLAEQAINVCNHITGWWRILYTDYTTNDDLDREFDLGGRGWATELGAVEAKYTVLSHMQERGESPLGDALTAKKPIDINRAYDSLRALGVPLIDVSIGKTFIVGGWGMIGAGFYTEACVVNLDMAHPDRVEGMTLDRGGFGSGPDVDPGTNGFLFRFDRNYKII